MYCLIALMMVAARTSTALAGFELATFGSSGKHTNHYTTKEIHVHYFPHLISLNAI
jgi:hypothetical protein